MSLLSKIESKKLLDMYEIDELIASDAMIKPVFLSEKDSAKKILDKLRKEDINTCIVVDEHKKFIGCVTENDIIKLFFLQTKNEPITKYLNHGYRRRFLFKKAKEMIDVHKSFVIRNTPINEVLKLMVKENFSYIPVVGYKDQVVGVITPSSIINLLKDF